MKKHLYISVMLLMSAMSFTLTSCSDFLEADNKSAGGQEAGKYFSTPEGLEAFRVNAYSSLKAVATSNTIQEDGTDLYVPSRGKTASQFQDYTLNAENEDVKKFYVSCFQIINNANGLIQYGGDKYRSEAYFLRAYGYYLLTQHFGAVPYSTVYINNSNRDYPREELKTIYDNCISDLKAALEDASLSDITKDGTVNKRAVAALLAKICLAAGWDLETTLASANASSADAVYTKTGTAYFEMAARYAELAVSGISLTQSFATKWSPDNESNNPETFFSVQYDRAGYPGDIAKGGHGLQNDYGSYYNTVVKYGQKGSSSEKVASPKANKLWAEGDERFEGTFMTTFCNYNGKDWGTTGYYAYYNSASKFNTMPIAIYYAPYYVTKADFEAFLDANKSRFVQGSNATTPEAYLLSDPLYKYTFKADGSRNAPISAPYDVLATLSNNTYIMPCVRKWDDPATIQEDQNKTNCYRDIVILHASASYLDAAEAYFMIGGAQNEAKAYEYINAVRTRANAGTVSKGGYAPDYKTSLDLGTLDLILDERARETYAESTRWMDLHRTRQLVRYNVAYNAYVPNVDKMSSNLGEIKWYRPIPTEELNSNISEGMYQNPGY